MFATVGEMTDADNVMNLQHLASDPADIQIQINPEIWIQISDHFWQRSALSEHPPSSVLSCNGK